MNHSEALEQMAAERYLLNELAADAREAFEEHAFDCSECALDLRAGALFIEEAKGQLPALADPKSPSAETRTRTGWGFSFSWWRPAFSLPAFAALLIVVAYQNVVTFPALRESGNEPHLAPVVPLRPATRGASPRTTLKVDRAHSIALPVDLSAEPGMVPPASYSISIDDAQGKPVWTSTLAGPAPGTDGEQRFSLIIPGRDLHNGPYSLLITSVSSEGERTPFDQFNFDIVVTH